MATAAGASAWAGPGTFASLGPAAVTLPPVPSLPPVPPLFPPPSPAASRPAVVPAQGAPVQGALGADLLTDADLALVRTSLAGLEPVADRATAHFYALLFLRHPELRQLFPPSMDVQRDRLFRALLAIARDAAEDPAAFAEQLARLGRAHRRFGVLPEHYPPVGECLVAALERYCGERWDGATERAWRRLYGLVSATMTAAAAQDAAAAPAWWQAEIVSCEHPAPGIAVLTLRTDQPYPFRAGQYAPVETPWWPRAWRSYSFAAAPGAAEGGSTLVFHVKAVPAGWVSNALVHRARPGDVIRLGPAAGGMVVDHAADRDLLCVGGGTGIAPFKAIAEEAAAHGRRGALELFYGVRREEEFYALDALRALERRHRWLTVRPVVAGPGARAARWGSGGLPEVVAALGPWHTYDVLLSGPPAMVRRTAGALMEAGVPGHGIRHDLAAAG